MSKIRINILSPGRFHVCDLARELDRNGFDVKFYSFIPTKRAEKFGLPNKYSCSLLYPLAPFLALEKVLFKGQRWANQLRIKAQDLLTGLVMRKCDVCISMSGNFLFAPRMAKSKGATIIIERGSKHILEQRRILESIPSLKGKKPVPDMNVKRELACYELADYIAIASDHVKRSFLIHNYPEQKLFVNPYGVDLSDFYPAKQEGEKKYDVIMVGAWCYRKGCDLIVDAVKQLGCSCLHVGSLGDCAFPKGDVQFTHVEAVDQRKLVHYFHKARVFVLPSREEGLAMVQAQAVACNLPLVGSFDSGAEDLQRLVEYPEYITLIKKFAVSAVADALRSALEKQKTLNVRYAGNAIENLTWQSYGKRYATFVKQIVTRNEF